MELELIEAFSAVGEKAVGALYLYVILKYAFNYIFLGALIYAGFKVCKFVGAADKQGSTK